jgi:hypothetical protein
MNWQFLIANKKPIVPNQNDSGNSGQFSAALGLLKQWIDVEESDSIQPLGNAAVYKTSVVFWLMLFQRLNPDSSLKRAVEYFFAIAPNRWSHDDQSPSKWYGSN